MKTTVTLLAAIMLAIGSAQIVMAQPSGDAMMKDEGMIDQGMPMDEGMIDEGMMNEGMMEEYMGNMIDEGMMEEGQDWSLEEDNMADETIEDADMGMEEKTQ